MSQLGVAQVTAAGFVTLCRPVSLTPTACVRVHTPYPSPVARLHPEEFEDFKGGGGGRSQAERFPHPHSS